MLSGARSLLALGLSVLASGPGFSGPTPDPFAPPGPPPTSPPCQLTWPLPQMVQPSSWMDHHFPIRQADGVMVRYDGARNAAYDGHRGLDLPTPVGTRVLAAADGLVVWTAWTDTGGYGVSVAHEGCRTIYYHNTALLVHVGDRVTRGEVIALSGSTGNSTGPHVHLEVRDMGHESHAIDPFGWTAPAPDPWPWDEGVLWLGGRPQLVTPHSGPGVIWRPPTDLDEALRRDGSQPVTPVGAVPGTELRADGRLVSAAGVVGLAVNGPAIAYTVCGDATCVLDLRGDLFVVRGAGAKLELSLPMGARALALSCAAAPPLRCVILDTTGELYPVGLEGAPAPLLADAPGVWPLAGHPAGLRLAFGAPADPVTGFLVDSGGAIYAFGPRRLTRLRA